MSGICVISPEAILIKAGSSLTQVSTAHSSNTVENKLIFKFLQNIFNSLISEADSSHC